MKNINPPLLYSCRHNPSIEPWTAKFCTQYANDFANTANPVFIPVFPFFNKQWWRGGGGRGVKCERVESMFNQELTPIWPRPNLILFDPLHCYKNSFTLLEITIGQEKIYGWSAQAGYKVLATPVLMPPILYIFWRELLMFLLLGTKVLRLPAEKAFWNFRRTF
jgi:hypothetical protein